MLDAMRGEPGTLTSRMDLVSPFASTVDSDVELEGRTYNHEGDGVDLEGPVEPYMDDGGDDSDDDSARYDDVQISFNRTTALSPSTRVISASYDFGSVIPSTVTVVGQSQETHDTTSSSNSGVAPSCSILDGTDSPTGDNPNDCGPFTVGGPPCVDRGQQTHDIAPSPVIDKITGMRANRVSDSKLCLKFVLVFLPITILLVFGLFRSYF